MVLRNGRLNNAKTENEQILLNFRVQIRFLKPVKGKK